MIIRCNDEGEIVQLKMKLAKEFEVKDVMLLRYSLGIEVYRGPKDIFLYQRKHVLDLLTETVMLLHA